MFKQFLLLLLALSAIPANARTLCERTPCSCAGLPSDAENVLRERNRNAAVFRGTIVRVGQDSVNSFAELRVSQSWKGVSDTLARIVLGPVRKATVVNNIVCDSLLCHGSVGSSITISDCDFSAVPGEEWLIFAQRDATGALTASVCSSYRPARASAFIATLDALGPAPQQTPDWTEPFTPFHIAGNLYYVGSRGLASYLVTTPAGHILINSDLEENVPMIQASIEQLGFKFSDVRVLLISHAHWDHDAGSAMIKALTGAKYMVMDADVPVVESGGKADFNYGDDAGTLYPSAKVDRVLHDGDKVTLGGAELIARLTPGHTKGCTTWTMKVTEGGRSYNVVIVGSPNVNAGYKLVGNTNYPPIADDFARTFRVLESLPVDIFLGAHGSYFGMEAKVKQMAPGRPSPFIDKAGYAAYVAERKAAFERELAKQRAAGGR